MKRVLLVADVSNLYYCVRSKFEGRFISYQALLDFANGFGVCHRAIAFGSNGDGAAQRFKTAIEHLGFELRFKDPKRVGQKLKADWDVGLAVETIQILDSVDVVVICSADGDLAPLVEHIRSRGKIAHVLGCDVSHELKDVVDRYTEIDETFLEKGDA